RHTASAGWAHRLCGARARRGRPGRLFRPLRPGPRALPARARQRVPQGAGA
ncbi:unnamed protein product, partial [Effrenium voratum]